MSGVPAPAFAQIDAFGAGEVPEGVDVLGIPATVGTLTAFHASPAGDARGTVFIVPGFTGSKEDFRTFLPLLVAHGWDVWAYSQRGQADSVGPVGVENYRLEDFAGDAIEVAGLVGGGHPVHVVGHSFGGVVVRAAAIAVPASFASVTLLCSGPLGWPGRHHDTTDTVAASGSIGLWNRDNAHTIGLPDADLTADEAFLRLRASRTSSDNLLAGAELLRSDPGSTAELRATGLPVHIAHGEFDEAWPVDWQREMAEQLGAAYTVIPGSAHSPQLEAPEATATALDDFFTSPNHH
ncbi:alpha/beta fold hydrolase [Leifsonia sp. NPDC058292]|uniref:alpha/beta fold hydrolase n=1 Tax=Leifsonia sp. NPDC058292 TaxID=3346428 RepID=UPI0036DF0C1E